MTDPASLALLTEIIARLDRLEQLRPAPEEADEILKTSEAAKLLRIGQAQVLELAHAGVLPHNRLGKSFLFSRRRIMEAFHALTNQDGHTTGAPR